MDDSFDTSQIPGNASDDIKRIIGNPSRFFQRGKDVNSPTFGRSILKRMKIVEISLNRKVEEEKKMEARVVVELDVTEG
jgi:acyl-coenzyme A thioesterase 13